MMRKQLQRTAIGLSLLGIFMFCNPSILAQRQLENLSRGLVAVKVSNGVFLSWRILGTEFSDNSYNIYRDGVKIATVSATGASNYLDPSGTTSNTYTISRSLPSGWEGAQCNAASVWPTFYKTINLSVPAGGTTPDGVAYTYTANDCSVGDLDGDTELEFVVKWDPSNSKDNSSSGYTGNVYLDGYEMDGTLKWRIDLGINVRAGAHYTQFIVYDLNGDGKAEVAFRGAPGTKGNNGTVIGGTTDYRNSSGYILSGAEYLCIASGASGNIVAYTTFYPDRGTVSDWGDTYGNRCDRFLAGVAYLDGITPSLIMARGYYTGVVSGVTKGQTKIVAYTYSGNTISQKWAFNAVYGGTNSAYTGQGNHNLVCADIDSDGYDEIVYGSCTIDHNGTGKYSTGLGHGDMLNVGDLNPNLSGKEVWQAHEGGSGATFRSASAGSTIWKYTNTGDVGRALSADIDAANIGEEGWAAGSGLYTCTGTTYSTPPSHCNFALWWDGDLQRELLNGTKLDKWVSGSTNRVVTLYNYASTSSNNGSKENPCLTADILGDWREEVVLRNSTQLVIYTTTTATSTRMYTLLHDYQYRTGVAAENVGYNICPRLSFYFGSGMGSISAPSITLKSAKVSTDSELTMEAKEISKACDFNISPNPVLNGSTQLSLGLSATSEVKVIIVNMMGKVVYKKNLGIMEKGIIDQALDVSTLCNGTYIIRIKTIDGIKTSKLLVL
jgi:rhamnogalacturonan endolyase